MVRIAGGGQTWFLQVWVSREVFLVPVFRSGGTSERTLVPVSVLGEQCYIRQNHPFGNHPFGFLRVLCGDRLIIPETFVWARLCLGRVFPGPVCALVMQVLDKGITSAHRWQCSGQPDLPSFLSARESPEHDPATSLRNSGIFSGEKSVLVWHRENRAQKVRPKIRPLELDAPTSAGTLGKQSQSPKAGHPKAGRSDFRNQRFTADTGKMRKMRTSLPPQENKGLRSLRRTKTRKTRKMRKMRTRKRGKCGKCG